jgi:cysteine dioxygenase
MAKDLDKLFRYLDGLHGRASLAALMEEVRELDLDCDQVAEFVRFSERTYARNLMRSSPWYYALVLCWANGQRSPIHDHRGSACAVRVLRGTMTETAFEFAPNGQVKAMGSRDYPPGSVIGSENDDMHQVSNLQAGSADLVTLHIYSPPLVNMRTFSLTDTALGVEPMLLEFSDAGGI